MHILGEEQVYTFSISPGHTLKTVGAVALGRKEHDLNVQIVNELKQIVDREGGVVDVTFLDTRVPLKSKVRHYVAMKNNFWLCPIEIHFNAFNGKAHGTEVYHGASSFAYNLADELSYAISKALGTRDRGPKSNGRLWFTKCHRNAVLIEVCFMDNKVEMDTRWDPVKAAEAIYKVLTGPV